MRAIVIDDETGSRYEMDGESLIVVAVGMEGIADSETFMQVDPSSEMSDVVEEVAAALGTVVHLAGKDDAGRAKLHRLALEWVAREERLMMKEEEDGGIEA